MYIPPYIYTVKLVKSEDAPMINREPVMGHSFMHHQESAKIYLVHREAFVVYNLRMAVLGPYTLVVHHLKDQERIGALRPRLDAPQPSALKGEIQVPALRNLRRNYLFAGRYWGLVCFL